MNQQSGSYPIIVTVAMLDSPHTARWLEQFVDHKYQFFLVPSTPHRRLHPDIKNLLLNRSHAHYSVSRLHRFAALPFGVLDILFQNRIRSYFLNRQLSRFKRRIAFIHVHEIQHAGYLAFKTIRKWPVRPKVVVSVWGSDLYWFQRFERHSQKIRELMGVTNHLICECSRDVAIAKSLNYRGSPPVIMPVSGGVNRDSHDLQIESPSQRKTILIKGYTGFVGRADLALAAIKRLAPYLRDFTIIVYSSDVKCRRIARKISANAGITIRCYRRRFFTQHEMGKLFRQSRLHIGISESDGIPRSVLEAMINGCFPIQTSTACVSELFEDGVGGFIVHIENLTEIDQKILRAITDDVLVDNAARANEHKINECRSEDDVSRKAQTLYETIQRSPSFRDLNY